MTDTAQEQIDAGRRVEQFLAEPAIEQALTDMAAATVRRWKAAVTPEEREAAWHEAKAVESFKTQLRAVVGRGQVATSRL
jgi:hypothetical protein